MIRMSEMAAPLDKNGGGARSRHPVETERGKMSFNPGNSRRYASLTHFQFVTIANSE